MKFQLFLFFSLFILTEGGIFDRIRSIINCGFRMDYKESSPCPDRCQFLYKQCLVDQFFFGCTCKPGYVYDYNMTTCITEQECQDLQSVDHSFIVNKVLAPRRGYNISCDFMNYCDLTKITKVGNKIHDASPIPDCIVDDQTVYWRGNQQSDVFYKGTTRADCNALSEKKQLFAMSLRRIWEADYKDEEDF